MEYICKDASVAIFAPLYATWQKGHLHVAASSYESLQCTAEVRVFN